jgi:hypothetical protein
MIVGLVGRAGAGKDTAAKCLVPRHLVSIQGEQVDIREMMEEAVDIAPICPTGAQIAIADPLKVFLLQVYQFSPQQLWGPSEFRNLPDTRYRRTYHEHVASFTPSQRTLRSSPIGCMRCGEEYVPTWAQRRRGRVTWPGFCQDHLTPREALQTLGSDWGRRNYESTWIDLALRNAKELEKQYPLVVISDVRYTNEMGAILGAGGQLVYLRRADLGEVRHHESEFEQDSHYVQALLRRRATTIDNDGSVEELKRNLWMWFVSQV